MADALYLVPTCATDCDTCAVPDAAMDDCLQGFHDEESEITDMFISCEDPLNPGQPLNKPLDWESKADWLLVIADTGADKVRRLIGIGDQAPATPNQRVVSRRRKKNGKKIFPLNFDIDDMNTTNHELVRSFECGGTYYIWFATYGGYIYGGPDGIRADVINADIPKGRGEGTYIVGNTQWEWTHTANPPRTLLPIWD